MRYIILLSLSLYLNALEITIQSGSDNKNPYSILHLREKIPFECSESKNEFGDTKKIECLFDSKLKQNLPPINSKFFNISASNNTFTITPKNYIKLIASDVDLFSVNQTFRYDIKKTKHWIVLGYKEPLYKTNDVANAINFPVKIAGNNKPYVGGIDLKGNPIKLNQSNDILDYIEMKKSFNRGDYQKTISIISKTLKEYPNTIFKNELLVYLIRSSHELHQYEDVVDASKIYLKKYSSDVVTPEILMYIANAYARLGQNGDSDYYFNRIFDEYSDSVYSTKAMIIKGELSELAGEKPKAAAYYDKALNETKDLQVASQAALALASLELNTNEPKKAKEYIDKILSANPQFFKEAHDKSLDIASTFNDKKYPYTAAKITEAILDKTDKKKGEYEALLRNTALMYTKAKQNNEAMRYINEYLDSYKDGEYIKEIEEAKDELFFSDKNSSNDIKKHDELISKYKDDDIAKMALYKKAKILYDQKKYGDVLKLKKPLLSLDTKKYPYAKSYIDKSAIESVKAYLIKKECDKALSLIKEYNIKLQDSSDSNLYECMLREDRFDDAKVVASKYIKSKNIELRQEWLDKLAYLNYKQGKYKDAIKGANDLLAIIDNNPKKYRVYRTLFDSARATNNDELMIKSIRGIEDVYGDDFSDIERFIQMINLGIKKKDNMIIQNYAKKVVALQNRTKSYSQTPFVEFAYTESLINSSKYVDALDVINSLKDKKLTNEQKARALYITGSIEQMLNRNVAAKNSYAQSQKISPNSPWGKLAKDALSLMK